MNIELLEIKFIRKCKLCRKIIPDTMRSHAIFCSSKCNKMYKKRPYNTLDKIECKICKFKPLHSCQLDIDHIDGNNKNNDISNLQILCANCHRLKTYLSKDWS